MKIPASEMGEHLKSITYYQYMAVKVLGKLEHVKVILWLSIHTKTSGGSPVALQWLWDLQTHFLKKSPILLKLAIFLQSLPQWFLILRCISCIVEMYAETGLHSSAFWSGVFYCSGLCLLKRPSFLTKCCYTYLWV